MTNLDAFLANTLYATVSDFGGHGIGSADMVRIFDDAVAQWAEHREDGMDSVVLEICPREGTVKNVTAAAMAHHLRWLVAKGHDLPIWAGGEISEEDAHEAELDRRADEAWGEYRDGRVA